MRARILSPVMIGTLVAALVVLTPASVTATFRGRNGRIVFAGGNVKTDTGCTYRETDIYTMNPDGSGLRNLTHRRGASWPAWSPDGKKIAFETYWDDIDDTDELRVMRSDGSGVKLLTRSAGNMHPTWSDHGFWIAYSLYEEEAAYDIYRVRSDGSRTESVLADGHSDEMPSYSPDGERIAFISDRGGDGRDIWTMLPDGTRLKRVTDGATTADGPGDSFGGFSGIGWSPDGRWILFTANRGEGDSYVYKVRRNGERIKRLVRGRDGVWSPNGKTIVYQDQTGDGGTQKGCTEELFRMNPDGSNKRQIRKDDGMQMLFFDWQSR